MSGDTLRWQQSVTRLKTVQQRVSGLLAVRDRVTSDLNSKRAEVESLSKKAEKLSLVGELLRSLMDKLVNEQVKSIETVVSEGLKTIFFDQDLTFEAEVSQKYNKVAIDFFLKQGGEALAVRGHPLESFGGGPSSLASLLLRLLALLRLKKAPILFLDETLAAVSDDYIDATGQFLAKLAASTKIDILLVTHKQAFIEHADVAYQGGTVIADDATWSLGLRKLKT